MVIGMASKEEQEAGDLLARYLTDANEALRASFGTAELPEHIPPSEIGGGGSPRGGVRA